jgi:hypothetical protein
MAMPFLAPGQGMELFMHAYVFLIGMQAED